jgi:hypothetical protein
MCRFWLLGYDNDNNKPGTSPENGVFIVDSDHESLG